MDLGAYAQIEDLNELMIINGISVPRLRGLRLMRDQERLTKEDFEEEANFIGLYACKSACQSDFIWGACWSEFSRRTDSIVNQYLTKDEKGIVNGIKWENVHGKKRKRFKYEMRQARKRVEKNFSTFNKYCGRDDVLYIHARIGGNNWLYYNGDEISRQSWFLEKVDDPFDNTYCDIYAKIERSK